MLTVVDQLPRLGKRELICLLSFTCNYVVFVWRGFLFLWVLGMGYVILLWHSLSLPYNYFESRKAVYHAFIMSTFDVCPPRVALLLKNKNREVRKDSLQSTEVYFQDFDATYVNLIMRAGTTTLHLSRLRGLALETFKIIHGNSPIYLNHFLTLKETCYNF